MSFVCKEISLLKRGYLYALGIWLLFPLYSIVIKLDIDFSLFFEGFLGATLALISADFVYGEGDEKIIISCTRNFISYLFAKFAIMLSLFFILLNVYFLVVQLFRGISSLDSLFSQLIILDMDCLVIFGFISTASIVTSFLTKTSYVAYGVGMIVFILETAFLKLLTGDHLPKWSWIFSLYGTGRIYPSIAWVLNKFIFLALTVIFWAIMYISYNHGKKDLVV